MSGTRSRPQGVISLLLLTTPAAPLARRADVVVATLSHTVHPPVARDASQLWMAPSASDRAAAAGNPALVHLQAALRLYADEKYEQALGRFSAAATPTSPLRAHAAYYAGVSELRLRRFDAATTAIRRTEKDARFRGRGRGARRGRGRPRAWAISGTPPKSTKTFSTKQRVDVPAIWLSLANAALADGDPKRAAAAYLHLYYEFPLSEHAAQAEGPLQTLPEVQPIAAGNARYKLEMGRGERLFGSRRYADARTSFLRLKPHAEGDADAELVSLRLAEIDYFQGRYSNAREALRPFLTSGARQAEARFFYLMSQRGLRNDDTFEQLVRALEQDFPDSTWAEEALNNLATFYIQRDRDDEADAVLREMYARFPRGRYAERAAWKAGWACVSQGRHERSRPLLRVGCGKLSAIGLPAGVAVLVGPRTRRDGRCARRGRALSADDCRLSQHVLRPARGGHPAETGGAARAEPPCVCAGCGAARRRGRLFSADRSDDSHAARGRAV